MLKLFGVDGWELVAVIKFLLFVELVVLTKMLDEREWNLDCTAVCLDTAAIVYGKHHLAPAFQEKNFIGEIYE